METKFIVLLAASVLALSACNKSETDQAADDAAATADQAAAQADQAATSAADSAAAATDSAAAAADSAAAGSAMLPTPQKMQRRAPPRPPPMPSLIRPGDRRQGR